MSLSEFMNPSLTAPVLNFCRPLRGLGIVVASFLGLTPRLYDFAPAPHANHEARGLSNGKRGSKHHAIRVIYASSSLLA